MEKENLMEKNETSKRCLLFGLETRELEIDGEEKKELWVEGRAVSFNSPTVLFEIAETQYKEQIDSRAFEETNMSDVIFNYNHGGKVLARTRNKTLVVDVREDGVYIRARLDGTEEGGYIDRMSFQFTIREQSYDKENHMWTVRKVKRLYDVSAVDIPAYDDTSIEARKNSVLEADAQEQSERKAAAELSKRKLQLKMKLSM